MDDIVFEGFNPPPEFKEDTKEPLLDLTPSGSTEFWLIQWPTNHKPDFDGQELTLKLHQDGNVGSFKDSSGKEYEAISFSSQQPNATVFVSSPSDMKIVGKISRRISFVHYSEPGEFDKHGLGKKMGPQPSATALTSSSHKLGTPQSSRHRNSRSSGGRTPASTHSSKQKSSLSEAGGESSRASKRRKMAEPGTSQSSGQGHSGVISESHQGKSKKRKEKKMGD